MNTALNLYGAINQLGYGQHFTNWAGNLCAEFSRHGLDVAIIPKGELMLPKEERVRPALHNLLMRVSNPSLFNPSAPSIMLWHLSNVAEFTGSKRYVYTVFEGSELSPLERENLRKIDGLIVPTHWHQERVRKCTNDKYPVWVIPEGIDPQVFFHGDVGLQGTWNRIDDEDATVFVSVGKLEKRKGMDTIVPALLEAYRLTGKPIRLLAHWFNPFIGPGGREFIPSVVSYLSRPGHDFTVAESRDDLPSMRFEHTQGAKVTIEVVTKHLNTQDELVSIYRAGHWGLFPHYAEGWGLPLHESMACGLPTITNNYSGPTEYLQPGTYLALDSVETVAQDARFFVRGDVGTWRQVTLDSMVKQIITALEMTKEERAAMGLRAAKAASVFTWQRAVQQTITVLEDMEVL